jgi:CBS domain-containing protein
MATRRFKAKDIMTAEVVCVRTGTSLRELERIFLEKGISGAPVVDDTGNLVGVISQTDLVYFHLTRGDRPFNESDFYRSAGLERAFESSGFRIENYDIGWVGEMMTPVVHTVSPEESIENIARLMTVARVHRVIVTENRKVVGLVSAMDLLKVIAGTSRHRSPASRNRGAGAAP